MLLCPSPSGPGLTLAGTVVLRGAEAHFTLTAEAAGDAEALPILTEACILRILIPICGSQRQRAGARLARTHTGGTDGPCDSDPSPSPKIPGALGTQTPTGWAGDQPRVGEQVHRGLIPRIPAKGHTGDLHTQDPG